MCLQSSDPHVCSDPLTLKLHKNRTVLQFNDPLKLAGVKVELCTECDLSGIILIICVRMFLCSSVAGKKVSSGFLFK